jgi:hypothetical protein
MRRFLIPTLVVALALLVAVPSFALEVKYGGLFRARVLSDHNFTGDGTGGYGYPNVALAAPEVTAANVGGTGIRGGGVPYVPHMNRFDQRLRMYFDFISSENLKVVTRLEANTVWGAYGNPAARNIVGGGNVGADNNNLGIKNAYVEFKIPNTMLTSKIGVQGISLLDSWIIDSDFSAAVVSADLKPFTIVLGYAAGQNYSTVMESDNVDDLVAVVNYKEGPFNAGLVFLWQDAHNVPASAFPTIAAVQDDPLQTNVTFARSFNSGANYQNPYVPGLFITAQRNNLFDLGVQLGYKIDYLSAYINFVKNFGSLKVSNVATANTEPGAADIRVNTNILPGLSALNAHTADYTGWMIDAGVNYFCGPFTANLGGFYTSGQKLNFTTIDGQPANINNPQIIVPNGSDISTFVYPLATSKYFSEIMGGGILDNMAPNGGYWRGYPTPTNIWTLTLGGAYQVLPTTKVAMSYWYFATSEKVPSKFNPQFGTWDTSSNLGHELDLTITQNIVDKLNLDLVGAIMFTGQAYRARTTNVRYLGGDQNAYELGARLQWAF